MQCSLCGNILTDAGYDICERCHQEEMEYANGGDDE